MEGERGLIEREGVLGPVGVSSLSSIASFLSRIPIVVSPYLACLCVPPLSCPHSLSSLSCPRSLSSLSCGRPVLLSCVFPCGCHGAWCQQAGRTSLGQGVLTLVLYRRLGDTSQQRRGTWFPLAFHGGGSHFCACGHPFVFIVGHLSLFGRSSSLSGQLWIVIGVGCSPHCVVVICGRGSVVSVVAHHGRAILSSVGGSGSERSPIDNDERRIQICRSSFGCHIAVSDVAPGMDVCQ